MQSDEQLIAEIKQGVESSMEVLVKRHYPMVFAYIYRNVHDYHLAYDLTQDTFMKMLRHLDSLTKQASFRHWLLKIALNTCRDYYSSRGYRIGQRSTEWDEERVDMQEERQQVVDLLERKAQSEEVKEALLALPVYQREAVILRFYHDLKIKDIASLTQATESTVKSRLKQGLAKLKAGMERGERIDPKKRRN